MVSTGQWARRGSGTIVVDTDVEPEADASGGSGVRTELEVPATPRGLKLVRHLHVRRTCADGRTWRPDATATEMSPSTMNPGFIKPDDLIEFDTRLDGKLIALLVDDPEYRKMLTAESIRRRWPSSGDKIRVALVDLTGDKICRPGYAGWGSSTRTSGASTPKIAMVYAAHQLVFDLNQLAATHGTRTAADLTKQALTAWSGLTCKPDLRWLVAIDESSAPVKVKKSAALESHLEKMVDASFSSVSTGIASDLILRLGFEYIASVLWQSGLRHPTREGLWIGNTFMSRAAGARLNPACHKGTSPVVWTRNPFAGGLVLTALSVATYFTLLAQQRLVDASASVEIERLLKRGCGWFSAPGVTVRANKCGLTASLRHDAALVEGSGRRYAVVCLTQNATWSWATRQRFLGDLDRLIKDNNP